VVNPVDLTLSGGLNLLLPITALLPLTAVLLVSQANPYQTLVLRGILGSVATLLYALLGAPDVALTEALVGTLLSTTLYAVALRSSMALRLSCDGQEAPPGDDRKLLREWLAPLHLHLRLLPSAAEDPEGCHGRIGQGRRLVLRSAPLAERLRRLEGYQRWREHGGTLDLEERP
jgi:putative multicomponent Na+:H+ antiporter subunit B